MCCRAGWRYNPAMKTWQKWAFLISGGMLLAGLSAGVATASIPDSGGVVHGCYKSNANGSNSALGVIDTALSGGHCPTGDTALTWNQTGPQGPQGPQGPAGSPGMSGYQLLTQSVSIGRDFVCSETWTMDIPAGKVVVGAGIDRPGGEDGFVDTSNGPDPGDSSKWEFEASDNVPNQGCGFDTSLTSWIAVVTVSS